LINTNENIEGIFPSINFQGILPTEIFPWYIPREKKLQQSKKKWWRVIFTNGIPDRITDRRNSIGNSVGKFVCKNMNTVHHVNYKGNHRRNCLSVFSRELQNCSLSNCTVNCCSLRTKSLTDWKVVGVIWRFSEKIKLI
jgi:hypothetical protein